MSSPCEKVRRRRGALLPYAEPITSAAAVLVCIILGLLTVFQLLLIVGFIVLEKAQLTIVIANEAFVEEAMWMNAISRSKPELHDDAGAVGAGWVVSRGGARVRGQPPAKVSPFSVPPRDAIRLLERLPKFVVVYPHR